MNTQNADNLPEARQSGPPNAAPKPTPKTSDSFESGRYAAQDSRRKSPVLAGMLSLLPGLGQVYVGYYQDGFINVVVVGAIIALLAEEGLGPLTPMAGFFLVFFWLYNVIDATRRASAYNQALAGMGSFELPDTIGPPGGKGTLLGGVLLVAFGILALANTVFGISLEWIEDWWPVAVILIGAYLIYKAIVDQQKSKP